MLIEASVPEAIEKYVKGGDTLRITGVYSSGVYMENPQGRTVLLHDVKCGRVPFGIGVPDVCGLIAANGFTAGQTAQAVSGELRFRHLTLALRIQPREAEKPYIPTQADIKAALDRGLKVLLEGGKGSLSELLTAGEKDEIKDPFARAAFSSTSLLRHALGEDDGDALRTALLGLLGLGTGLTPSLDDFLSACCATLLRARDFWKLPVSVAGTLCDAVVSLAPEKTGAISAAYLLSSASGEESESLADVLRPKPELMNEGSVRALLEIGAGSGADMLAGALFSLRFLQEKYVSMKQ